MSTNPHDDHRQHDEAHIEDLPPPEPPMITNDPRQVPEAVEAADLAKRQTATASVTETTEVEAAEVEQKLQEHRTRGLEWVRPTDLIARNSASLAGRGIDLEVEMARRARAPMVDGVKNLGERVRRLSPLSAFGHDARHHVPTRSALGKS